MKFSSRLICAGLTAASLVAMAAQADARPRRKHHTYPSYVDGDRAITVTRRSFLDSGTSVPVGSRNQYVQEITRFERPPLANTSPGILWRPDPGPPEPLF